MFLELDMNFNFRQKLWTPLGKFWVEILSFSLKDLFLDLFLPRFLQIQGRRKRPLRIDLGSSPKSVHMNPFVDRCEFVYNRF